MEDRLWRRVFASAERHSRRFSSSFLTDTVLRRDDIIEALLKNEGFRFMTDCYVNIDKSRIDPRPTASYKTFEWTDDELEKIGIEAWHSDVVLIGNEFWITCPCPLYTVDHNSVIPVTAAFPKLLGGGFFERSADRLGDVSRHRRPFDERAEASALSLHFGVDEYEHAVTIASSGLFTPQSEPTSKSERIPATRQGVASKIETILPQCVAPTALATAAMTEACSLFVKSVSRDGLGHYRSVQQFDAAALIGMATLQEVAFANTLEEIDPDNLADAMEVCLEKFSSSVVEVPTTLRILMETSIARVRNRVIDTPFG
jgi:hypothetical protein